MPRPPISGMGAYGGGLGGYGRRFSRETSKIKFDPKKQGRLGMAGGLTGGGAGLRRRARPEVERSINERFDRFTDAARSSALPKTPAAQRTAQLHEVRRQEALRRAADARNISKALPELPLGDIPRRAMHASHGRVHVLAYHGNDRFTVLTKRDRKVTVHRNTLRFLRDVGKADKRAQGSAMTATGAVVGGTGLIAGGVPGVREPDSLRVWLLRGHNASGRLSPKEVMRPSNVKNNVRQIAPQPRAGILGFRANMHHSWIEDQKTKKPGANAYVKGYRSGKLKAEHEIVHGMRVARRASYPVTLGGAALVAAGLHRKHQAVGKRDKRQRGAVAGTSGAVGGSLVGAYGGLRGGAELGVAEANRRIRRDHVPGTPFSTGDRMVRRMHGLKVGIRTGLVAGPVLTGAGGYRLARGKKVTKADDRRSASSAALAGGLTAAGVGHFAPKGLRHYEQRYVHQAQEHTLAAQKLAPHFGGLKVLPAKIGAFGETRRPARTTMYPEVGDNQLRAINAHRRVKGAQVRAKVGEHRGIAAQARHFAEVFNSTGKVIGHARGPGLAVAGAGATGLWASSEGHQRAVRNRQVGKSVTYGYQETKRSIPRTAEMGGALGLLAYGVPRLKMLGPAAQRGIKLADAHGGGKEARAVLQLGEQLGERMREVTGRGEKAIRRNPKADSVIRAVPRPLRGEVATALGTMLAMHAHPTTHRQFTPA